MLNILGKKNTVKINIFSIVGSNFCVEAEDGEKVYELLRKALAEMKMVEISFLNVELLTTAFLNSAVGKLYGIFSEELLKKSLSVKEITPSGAVSLKRVVETTKAFYKNPEALQESINKILEE